MLPVPLDPVADEYCFEIQQPPVRVPSGTAGETIDAAKALATVASSPVEAAFFKGVAAGAKQVAQRGTASPR
jgi:fructose-1-phosphate kinase PfkB-like protein